MEKWVGASGVCINDNNELLMVLQGKPEEKKTWSVPSGELEKNETIEECCIREVDEETGYKVKVVKKLKEKRGGYEELNILFEVHYYLMKIVGGEKKIQDPDELIYDISWKNADEIKTLELSFPEDREYLIRLLQKYKTAQGDSASRCH